MQKPEPTKYKVKISAHIHRARLNTYARTHYRLAKILNFSATANGQHIYYNVDVTVSRIRFLLYARFLCHCHFHFIAIVVHQHNTQRCFRVMPHLHGLKCAISPLGPSWRIVVKSISMIDGEYLHPARDIHASMSQKHR